MMGSVGSSRREETIAFSLSALKALVKLEGRLFHSYSVRYSKMHVTL